MGFEDLKKKANDLAQQAAVLAQAGASRSRQFAAVAKLKAANLGEEDTIRKAYMELGKQYFAKYGEHAEDEFVAACATIIEAQAAIAANNALVEELMKKPEPEVTVEEPVEEATEEATEETPAVEEAVEETPAEEEAVEVVEDTAATVTEVVEEVAEATEETAAEVKATVEAVAEVVEEATEETPAVEEAVEETPVEEAPAEEEKTEE